MDLEAVNREVKREFEEEWAGTSVENLLITNQYPRAKEEFACFEKFLPKYNLILEAGCGLGPKLIYFTQKHYSMVGVDYVFSALERVHQHDCDHKGIFRSRSPIVQLLRSVITTRFQPA